MSVVVTVQAASPEIVARAGAYVDRTAILDDAGAHTYRDLLDSTERAATVLFARLGDCGHRRIFSRGAVVFSGTPDQLRQSHEVSQAHLGVGI